MTTITDSALHLTPRHLPQSSRPLLIDVVRSEWTKLKSVRSTYWTLLTAIGAAVGISALATTVYVNQFATMSVAERARFNPTSFSLNGLFLAQLAIGVLGTLIITGEYSTAAIRSTFAAVPQRRTVLAAKAAVFAAVSLVVGMVASFGAFFVGQAILAGPGLEAQIGDPGVLRSVAGAGLYLAILGLTALGLGTLIRHTAGAISALFGALFVLPVLANALPASWTSSISPYLPSNAGQAIYTTVRNGSTLSPWVGLGVFCLYAAVVLGLAAVVIQRRDA